MQTPTDPATLLGLARSAAEQILDMQYAGGATIYVWLLDSGEPHATFVRPKSVPILFSAALTAEAVLDEWCLVQALVAEVRCACGHRFADHGEKCGFCRLAPGGGCKVRLGALMTAVMR